MSRTRAEARDYMEPARYLKLVVAGFSPRSETGIYFAFFAVTSL